MDGAAFSSLYRTTPQGDPDQDDFWNAAVCGSWPGTADSLLERLLMLESRLGRLRDPARPKGPRVLDLDLLAFGNEVRETPRLWLPHPRLAERRFALEPLIELDAVAADPSTGRLWAELPAALGAQGVDRTDLSW